MGSLLGDDVCQSMVAVVQGKEPLVDDRSLHNITTSADDIAALDESDRLAPGAGDPVPDRYRALVDAYYRGLAGAAVSRSAPSR